jgi:phenylalanyl-tRNA synthetase beta chain
VADATRVNHQAQVQVFEIGHIYLPNAEEEGETAILPTEQRRLVLVMTGPREPTGWLPADTTPVDFFDLKGVIESLVSGLYLKDVAFKPTKHHAYHPGRVAEVVVGGPSVGVFGQLHPLIGPVYQMKIEAEQPLLAADFDLDLLLSQVEERHVVVGVPRFPPVQQDIAVIVDEAIPAEQVRDLIAQTGQPLLNEVRLFDVYRGEQVGTGKKSLAYSLTFQSNERTLTDKVVARQQDSIIKRLERELGAKLRA